MEFAYLVLRQAEPFAGPVNVLHFCKPCVHITKRNLSDILLEGFIVALAVSDCDN